MFLYRTRGVPKPSRVFRTGIFQAARATSEQILKINECLQVFPWECHLRHTHILLFQKNVSLDCLSYTRLLLEMRAWDTDKGVKPTLKLVCFSPHKLELIPEAFK